MNEPAENESMPLPGSSLQHEHFTLQIILPKTDN